MDLDTLETDAIQLDISTDINFDSLMDDSDDLHPQPLPFSTLLDPRPPAFDERPSPVFPLFPDLDLEVALFSPLMAYTPSLQSCADEPGMAQEVVETSNSIPCLQTELQAAVQSILPESNPVTEAPEDSTPVTSEGPNPCPVPTTENLPDEDILA